MAEVVGYDGGSQHGQSVQVIPFKTSNASLKVLLLHGNLDIWVKEAKNLPNMDQFHNKLGQVFSRLPTFSGGKNKTEDGKPEKVTSDPYVTVSIANAVIARTFVISNSENPVWMQHFHVPVAHYSAEVQFVVKDSDVVGSQIMGAVGVPVEQLVSGSLIEGTFPVLNESGKPCKRGAVLTLSIQYIPMMKVPLDLNFNGVAGTYFPLRRGGKVTLYQDAHVDDGYLPNMHLDGGLKYRNGDCWHDICEAIKQARRLIYITGWSVFHSVQLVRNGDGAKDSCLGDLLKAKSSEGVRVLLLIWDDPTSRSILGIKTQGVMQTNDEETRRFFKHSSVKVLLCPRSAGKGHSWAKKQEVETIYTHHQKTVIVDADAGNYRRRIMAFVGGLDLCVGRYDTPSHPIFSTLQTLHKDDYHQPNYTGPTTGCPREPWHDLHSRIEGPAAYDVLKNFEERWLRASKPQGIRKMKKSEDDSLLKLERIPDILGIDEAHCTNEQDPEGWHVQVFRSIDSNSVKGFPKDPKEATSKNLVCGKNVLIDMSIHTAYVKAIRAAQHFIYIENQYFLGSSFNWSNYKTLGANNLIPMEIALKIANKIRAKERFAVYIVIPMWPEGSPTSTATQRILFWQNKTMQMMYEVIYKALQEVGLENVYEPQDYLNFFCLGTRESSHGAEPTSNEKGSNGANAAQLLSKKNRRFMIYVHSKGMIVDDEFVIMGSANINQRSLEGSRDTEIAMGAYQPYHTWAHKRYSPHGQVFGYRMSLWAEHIGGLESTFEVPESLECVRRVRSLSEANWNQYAAVEVTDMKAHLLKYPVEVDRTGQVKPLPGCPNFPDLGGTIVGTFSAIQENLTI
ncbi:putative phospholipase D [Helianthus annuus]|nr:putative phospholipase D [Helianthus annuus]